jgi:tRNA1Val (adenine37-N6)-methyltransferase
MPNSYFNFKQFRINQFGAAMKVGTDGVLLGAWARLDGEYEERATQKTQHVLDIGTGTGVIALMAAQRCPTARIDAVESDDKAARQAEENARNSPWPERIRVIHTTIQDFAGRTAARYDHILSNPPFFVRSLKALDAARSAARHNDALPFDDLAAAVDTLLAPQGRFSVVYPVEEAAAFQAVAESRGLFCNRRLQVRGTSAGPFRRTLMEFSRRETPLVDEELTIETAPMQYTEAYMHLTRDFYLKF